MVIFKRKTIPKEKFPNGIIVKASEKGWMNQEIMQIWLKNVFFKPKSLLIYDSATPHLTPEVKKLVNSYSQLAVIPGGLTKKLQPLDISVNKSFTHNICSIFELFRLYYAHTAFSKLLNFLD